MEDQRIKRTGASTRPHPRWSWAGPVTGAVRRGSSRGNPEPGPAARRTAAAAD